MRLKTDARREAIIATAADLFREVGFERASMSMISARVGGSKATLYNYFKSKEELFAVAMIGAVEEQAAELTNILDPAKENLRDVLENFGRAYLELITAPDAVSVTRAAVADGSNSQLGKILYERGPRRGWEVVTNYITELQQRGLLRPIDPRTVTFHLKGLLETGFVEPLMFGADPEFMLGSAVEAAVDAFLQVYRL